MPFGAAGEFVGVSNPPSSGGGGGPALTGTSLDVDSPAANPTGIQITDDSGQTWTFTKLDAQQMQFIAQAGGVLWQSNGGGVQLIADGAGGFVNISNPGSDRDLTIDAGSGGTASHLFIICDGDGGIQMFDNGTDPSQPTNMTLRLPTVDPGSPGQLWNDAGTVKVST